MSVHEVGALGWEDEVGLHGVDFLLTWRIKAEHTSILRVDCRIWLFECVQLHDVIGYLGIFRVVLSIQDLHHLETSARATYIEFVTRTCEDKGAPRLLPVGRYNPAAKRLPSRLTLYLESKVCQPHLQGANDEHLIHCIPHWAPDRGP